MPRPRHARRRSSWKADSTTFTWPEPIQDLLDNGDEAFPEIVTALAHARLTGEDVTDPAVCEWAIATGRANRAEARETELIRPGPDAA